MGYVSTDLHKSLAEQQKMTKERCCARSAGIYRWQYSMPQRPAKTGTFYYII